MMDVKSFTLRLPVALYRQVVARKNKSISSFVVEAVEEKLARDRVQELEAGFACLAGPIDGDASAWQKPQRKAMYHAGD